MLLEKLNLFQLNDANINVEQTTEQQNLRLKK